MRKTTQLLFIFALYLVSISASNAQSDCKFIFAGTLAGKAVTMCFFEDQNDGNVEGTYYYGTGSKGSISFAGTAKRQKDGSYSQRLEEKNADGVVTGYFTGNLKAGAMKGTWTSADGKRTYPYALALKKQ